MPRNSRANRGPFSDPPMSSPPRDFSHGPSPCPAAVRSGLLLPSAHPSSADFRIGSRRDPMGRGSFSNGRGCRTRVPRKFRIWEWRWPMPHGPSWTTPIPSRRKMLRVPSWPEQRSRMDLSRDLGPKEIPRPCRREVPPRFRNRPTGRRHRRRFCPDSGSGTFPGKSRRRALFRSPVPTLLPQPRTLHRSGRSARRRLQRLPKFRFPRIPRPSNPWKIGRRNPAQPRFLPIWRFGYSRPGRWTFQRPPLCKGRLSGRFRRISRRP